MAARIPALGRAPVMPARHTLTLPGWEIRIAAPDRIAAALAPLLTSLSAAEPLPPLEVTVAEDRLATGAVDGRVLWSVTLPEDGWLPLLLGQVAATGAALLRRLLFIHAGAVTIDGRAWIVVGESGAGKTSTVAVMVRQGAAYLTDEITLLDPEAATAVPFALPMAVKPWTAQAVGTLPRGAEVAREGGVRFYLPAARAAGAAPVEGFVLLRPDGGGLAPLSRAELLMVLGEQQHSSLRYAHRLEDAFAGFSHLLRSARCYVLAAPSPAVAAELIVAAARCR